MLRARRMLGLKWRRQHPIYGYVADFFCVEHGLVLEVDGDIHLDAWHSERDALRDTHLRARGCVVLRIRNSRVDRQDLERMLIQLLGIVPPLPLAREELEVRADGEHDRVGITAEGVRVRRGVREVATARPPSLLSRAADPAPDVQPEVVREDCCLSQARP